ncbi:MAG TPA: NADH-quinone oxidoreductase subunit NuoE [Elusimicrobiales bacterium]|nr:NADH-quinone oxidoreductase subunit NuoE [Elusimicrobiales bacterium]HPO96222.1 NADH-quinone oxidoreductase subunit NuoE [Elusimicrobiales bacterium]
MSKIKTILKKYENARRGSLIPMLQEIQEAEGYVSKEAVKEISRIIGISASKVYGVATFYNQFRFEPLGKYHIMVCRGTACHVKGSSQSLNIVQEVLKINPGQTTKDGLFSLETVACMGACSLAPVISINGEFYGEMTAEKLKKLISDIKEKEKKNEGK